MSTAPVATRHALTILSGPERAGSEQRWRVRLEDGRLAVLGRLLPELATDPAIRRRYVHDLDRLLTLADAGLAPILEVGPTPDPRDPAAPPPWRLRLDPPGETLASWLARRAPAPVDEVSAIGAAIADRLAEIHDRGVILRDLAPRTIVLGDDHRITFTDVGLARVDILSTRSAASLLIEDSPYVAPEELARTIVDPRADLHRLGVILFQALTGGLPFGDGPALLRSDRAAPGLRKLRADVPPALEAVILRCLTADPGQRPATAREVAAILRGHSPGETDSIARVVCQACGAPLRLGQRLCLGCGKEAVRFAHAEPGAPTFALVLTKASEDTAFTRNLQQTLAALASAEVPALNLVIGDRRMYSKAELARRHPLPLRLFDNLSKTTAEALRLRLAEQKIVTRVRKSTDTPQRRGRRIGLGIAAAAAMAGLALLIAGQAVPAIIVLVTAAVISAVSILATRRVTVRKALLALRPAPAALPASDPLVRRLAAHLGDGLAADIREPIAELALLVQRLVDHRAANAGEAAELDRVLAPIVPLVDLIDVQVRGLRAIDGELRGLEEGAMVRALAASEARGEPPAAREHILAGLDRLRALEDQRALALHRLLSAGDLLRRAADLGLGVHDEAQAHERQLQLALHALGE